MHIVLACRSLDRCRVARDELLAASHSTTTLTCAPLDLSLRASVRALVHDHLPRLFSHHNNTTTATSTPFAVDILIDNAGLWSRDDHEAFTQDAGIEIHTAVNHLGHVLLVHLLWPHLQLAPQPARVVSVSSLAAILPRDASAGWYPTGDHHTNNADDADNDPHSSSLLLSFSSYWQTIGHAVQHYARSKRANLMFAAELQDRYASTTNITSVASHPGYTRTNILLSGGSFLPKMVRNWLMENTLASMSATQGAWTQVRAAVDIDNIAGGTHVGPLYWTCGRAVAVANLRARWSTHFWPFTRDESQRLWEQSMEALGITEFGVR
jgi:NAD(P)-dependent dehydrogenase (short-subunit alcohol dehydrogenase family)